jgi:membrane-associated phospholipid phosphatase
MNPNLTPLRNWCIGLGLTILSVVIAYFWLDRPIAYFVHDHILQKNAFISMQRIPEAFPLLSVLVLAWCGLWTLAARTFSRFQAAMLSCSLSFIAAEAVNSQLKIGFGRTWPETWIDRNPSLIQNGAYGFNPFHGGPGFMSFPSGHTAAICSVMSVLWFCYPRLRALWAAGVAAVVVGLLGADFHFLSDILAGAFVGATAGWIVYSLRSGARANS